MDSATVSNLDQTTIGAGDLRSFIEVLDDFGDAVYGPPVREVSQVTAELRVALGMWHRCIMYHTGLPSVDRGRELGHDRQDRPQGRTVRRAVEKIDLHLGRLIRRHSNFGFATSNVTRDIDAYFPEAALTHVRVARSMLRQVLTTWSCIQGTGPTDVPAPTMSVCAW